MKARGGRRETPGKVLRNGVHHADAVVWGPVYRMHLERLHRLREELDDVLERLHHLRGLAARDALLVHGVRRAEGRRG